MFKFAAYHVGSGLLHGTGVCKFSNRPPPLFMSPVNFINDGCRQLSVVGGGALFIFPAMYAIGGGGSMYAGVWRTNLQMPRQVHLSRVCTWYPRVCVAGLPILQKCGEVSLCCN